MNSKTSIYLDLLRILAALVVVLSHLSPFSNNAALPFEGFGHVAVIVFFVLSGYVIDYVADTKERAFKDYAAHRLARLYSVVVPALILTFALDHIGAHIHPATYHETAHMDRLIIRWPIHLLFLQEVWFISVQFFSNGPLWSLSYEFWYYAIFGFAFLYKGPYRWPLTMLCAAIAGPVILIYGLIWLAGNFVYKLHKTERVQLSPILWTLIFAASLAGVFTFSLWSPMVDTGFDLYGKAHIHHIQSDFIFAAFTALNIAAFKYRFFGHNRG